MKRELAPVTLEQFSDALRSVLNENATMSRSRWYNLLGVDKSTVSNWLGGRHVPRAETLRTLVDVLERDFSDASERALFEEMLDELVDPKAMEVIKAETLGNYMTLPQWERLHLVLRTLPWRVQEKLIGVVAEAVRTVDEASQVEEAAEHVHSRSLEKARTERVPSNLRVLSGGLREGAAGPAKRPSEIGRACALSTDEPIFGRMPEAKEVPFSSMPPPPSGG